jgi:hypothetical protein
MPRLMPLRPLGENPLRSSLEVAVRNISEQPEFLRHCEASNGLPVFWIRAERHAILSWRAIADWFIRFAISGIRQCGSLPLFRGIPLEACERVLMNGVDVVPTNSVIWANDLPKALEYGGENQLIMIFNRNGMRRSYLMLDPDAGPDARPIFWATACGNRSVTRTISSIASPEAPSTIRFRFSQAARNSGSLSMV